MKTSNLDHMSQGKRKEIAEMYKDQKIPVREILETYKISYKVLYACTEEFGVPYRDEKKRGKRTNIRLNQCPNCHSGISIMEARFCPFCGTSISTEEDLLLDDPFQFFQLFLLILRAHQSFPHQDGVRTDPSEVFHILRIPYAAFRYEQNLLRDLLPESPAVSLIHRKILQIPVIDADEPGSG